MKKEIKTSFIFSFCILLIIVSFAIRPAHGDSNINNSMNLTNNITNGSLIIAEDDILSFYISPNYNATSNLTIIINPEVWIINNNMVPETITINSALPKEDYRQLSIPDRSIYPVFGNSTLQLGNPLSNYFSPNNATVLGNPNIQEGIDQVNYTWNNITIAPLSTVIVSYINYFEDGSEFYKTNTINLPSASISRTYSSNNSDYKMDYKIEDTGMFKLSNFNFSLFFPEIINGTQLINPSKIIVNTSEMNIINNVYSDDGTGSLNKGQMISSSPNCSVYLAETGQLDILIEVNGTAENPGKIFPAFYVSYNIDSDPYNITGNIVRIWPATQIISNNKINITRFYTYEVSMAIPENNYFTITQSSDTSTSIPTWITISAFILAVVLVIAKRK